jgi:hypothetical protein
MAIGLWFLLAPIRTMLPAAVPAIAFLGLVAFATRRDLPVGRAGGALHGRQVPATWRARYGDERAFAAYGFVLGAGALSFTPYALTFIIFAWAGLLMPLGGAIVIGAVFGGARAASVAIGSLSPARISSAIFRSGKLPRHLPWASACLDGVVGVLALIAFLSP